MVRWILSPDTFGENLKQLKTEIIKQGHEYIDIEKYFQFRVDDISELGDESNPTIFYGSIESGQHILRNSKVYPGVYCNLPQFKCSYYYPRLYKYLLNQHHVFLPFGLLKEKKEWLFAEFGQDRTVFIRPTFFFIQKLMLENIEALSMIISLVWSICNLEGLWTNSAYNIL